MSLQLKPLLPWISLGPRGYGTERSALYYDQCIIGQIINVAEMLWDLLAWLDIPFVLYKMAETRLKVDTETNVAMDATSGWISCAFWCSLKRLNERVNGWARLWTS